MARRGRKKKQAGEQLTLAPDVEEIARRLIREKGDILERLDATGVHYLFTFTNKSIKKAGKDVPGDVARIGGEHAWHILREMLHRDADLPKSLFRLRLNEGWWKSMTPAQREAQVFHLLCHCRVDETLTDDAQVVTKLRLAPPEIVAFSVEVQEYGLWSAGLQQFGKKAAPHMQQLSLGLETPGRRNGRHTEAAPEEQAELAGVA